MLIDNLHLFELSKIGYGIPAGYYLDAHGNVYSKLGGSLRKLGGATSRSGTSYRLGSRTHTKSSLLAAAMRHKDWKAETEDRRAFVAHPMTTDSKVVSLTSRSDRSHAKTAEEGVKAKGSIIGRLHKGHLVFGSEPKIHMTAQSVSDELVSLASKFPGVKFVELKVVRSVVSGGVVWE